MIPASLLRTKLRFVVLYGLALAYFIWLTTPDYTFANTGVDTGAFIWSAKQWPNIGLTHPTGYPLFNWINGLLLLDDPSIQASVQRIALVSALASATTALVLYVHSKKLIAPLVFIASGVVVSQSTIVEVYAIATLLAVLIYVTRKDKWRFWVVAVLALGTHHFIGLALLPVLWWRWQNRPDLRKLDWLIFPTALVQYGLLLFAVRPELIGWSDLSWRGYFSGQSFMFMGITPEARGHIRLYEFLGVVVGGFGLSILFITLIIKWHWRKDWLLALLVVLPLIYYVSHLIPQSFTYTMPAFAFAGLMLAKHWRDVKPLWKKGLVINSLVLVAINLATLDIGNNLDPAPTTARVVIDSMESLPEGSVVYTGKRGWEQLAAWHIDGITVVADEKWLLEIEQGPDYVTVVDNAERYGASLIACSDWNTCLDRSEGDYYLERPRIEQPPSFILGDDVDGVSSIRPLR